MTWKTPEEFEAYYAKYLDMVKDGKPKMKDFPFTINHKQWQSMLKFYKDTCYCDKIKYEKPELKDSSKKSILQSFGLNIELKPLKPKKKKLPKINFPKAPDTKDYKVYLKSKYWRKLRKMVIARDKICQICGYSQYLQVHHKSYKNKGNWKKEINDLVVLCGRCHKEQHNL